MIPPYNVLLSFLTDLSAGGTTVTVPERSLRAVIQYLVSMIPFDAESYLETDPNLAAALGTKNHGSPQDHFLNHGYFEGRPSSNSVIGERFDLENRRTIHAPAYEKSVNNAIRYLRDVDLPNAEEELLTAIRVHRSGVNSHRLLAHVFLATGRPLMALDELSQVPENLWTSKEWSAKQKVYQILGLNESRLNTLLLASELNPDFRKEHQALLAEALLAEGLIRRAASALSRLPDSRLGGRGRSLRSELVIARKDARSSLKALISAFRTSQCAEVASDLALLLARLSFTKLSARIQSHFLRNAHYCKFNIPSSAAEKFLESARLVSGAKVAATKFSGWASQIENEPEVCLNRAFMLIRAGHISEGLGQLESVKSRTNDVKFLSHLARALLISKRFEEALAVCRHWQDVAPRSSAWAPLVFTSLLHTGKVSLSPSYQSNAKERPTQNNIPFSLMRYWNDPSPPKEVEANFKSWQDNNPEFTQVVFSNSSARDFLQTYFEKDVTAAFGQCHHAAMEADFFRLAYLYKCGGVYVDSDNASLKPLKGLLSILGSPELICEFKAHASINNSFLGATAGNSIIARCLETATKNILEAKLTGRKIVITEDTGPGVLTNAVAAFLLFETDYSRPDLEKIALVGELFLTKFVAEADMLYKAEPHRNWRLAG